MVDKLNKHIYLSIYPKKVSLEKETPRNGEMPQQQDHVLLFQRTWLQFLPLTLHGSQLPVTPGPENLTYSPSLCGHCILMPQTPTQRHTHTYN